MTTGRSSGHESGRRAQRRMQTHGARPLVFGAAVRRVRSAVAVARLVGQLSASERRALDALIATLARLLGEEVSD